MLLIRREREKEVVCDDRISLGGLWLTDFAKLEQAKCPQLVTPLA